MFFFCLLFLAKTVHLAIDNKCYEKLPEVESVAYSAQCPFVLPPTNNTKYIIMHFAITLFVNIM